VAEQRIRILTKDRSRPDLVERLRVSLEALRDGTWLQDVRTDEWWDEEAPEVWMRTTEGVPVRWRVQVDGEGYLIHLRGPLAARVRRPPALRELIRRLRGGS
jgi:hypothetical protein